VILSAPKVSVSALKIGLDRYQTLAYDTVVGRNSQNSSPDSDKNSIWTLALHRAFIFPDYKHKPAGYLDFWGN